MEALQSLEDAIATTRTGQDVTVDPQPAEFSHRQTPDCLGILANLDTAKTLQKEIRLASALTMPDFFF
jgi:hypothetical protein